MLIETIQVLALPYDQQKVMFPDFVDIPFEIIDDFCNSFSLLPVMVEQEMFSYPQLANILRLYNNVEWSSRRLELQDLDEKQFETHEDWNFVRKLAGEVLQQLNIQ